MSRPKTGKISSLRIPATRARTVNAHHPPSEARTAALSCEPANGAPFDATPRTPVPDWPMAARVPLSRFGRTPEPRRASPRYRVLANAIVGASYGSEPPTHRRDVGMSRPCGRTTPSSPKRSPAAWVDSLTKAIAREMRGPVPFRSGDGQNLWTAPAQARARRSTARGERRSHRGCPTSRSPLTPRPFQQAESVDRVGRWDSQDPAFVLLGQLIFRSCLELLRQLAAPVPLSRVLDNGRM